MTLKSFLFNFPNHSLTEQGESLLSTGMNLAIPPEDVNYADYLPPFELLFTTIDLCEIPNYGYEFIRRRLKECVLTPFTDSDNINKNNLFKEEHLVLKDLMKN